jgi:hypothetical protein
MSQVWELELSHNVQSVFLALADHADDDGYCYPSVGRLAWKTGYGVRQVQRTLKDLRDNKLAIPMGSVVGGRHNTVVYKLDPTAGKQKPPFQPRTERQILADIKGDNLTPFDGETEIKGDTQDVERVTSTTQRVTPRTQKGDIAMTPEPSGNHHRNIKEPSEDGATSHFEYPEWFQPLTALKGFKSTAHKGAIQAVREGCEEAGVNEAEVVRAFADYYRDGGRATNGWSDPVAALVRTLPVQIGKGRKSVGRPPPKVFSVNSQDFAAMQAAHEARQAGGPPNL